MAHTAEQKKAARERYMEKHGRELINQRQRESYARRKSPDYVAPATRKSPVPKPMRMYIYHIQRTYGLSLDDLNNMLHEQNNSCAICRAGISLGGNSTITGTLCVDHCHNTGAVRGLLCRNCNRAIGFLQDDVATVLAAANYLSLHK